MRTAIYAQRSTGKRRKVPFIPAAEILPYRGQTVDAAMPGTSGSILAYHDGDTWREHETGDKLQVVGWRWLK